MSALLFSWNNATGFAIMTSVSSNAMPHRKGPRPGRRGPLFCSLLLRSARIRRGFAERELVPRDPTVKPCSGAFVPLDHDVSRSGRPKNMTVIDSQKLRRTENRTLFLIPL
ncbi:hypothetical protein GOA59_20140 [Sinorhizobium meliloti]|nr:hypothetical protein [Sinorhizobium meliloti]MDW9607281.1 hypothetical protein [Sinorhizobium meliloti]MDW9675103.1 hypothetical protein [Sinorhizobium meliloti]MDW9953995.1 hypothetical protein [Sinorhizobium meliloti]MDX0388766.1 hypothetical protein [Sinorhizobium meliloti]